MRADRPIPTARIEVWDFRVRLFHWALVAIVLSNRFFNEGGGDWHDWLGYAACALIAWRIYWGFAGTPYARFGSLKEVWPGRGQFLSHARVYLSGKSPRTLGHSPLASIGMASMLLCVLLLGLTGWMMEWDLFFGEEWVEETHEVLSHVLIGLAILHVVGVVRESLLHRENLIASMVHGKKRPDGPKA